MTIHRAAQSADILPSCVLSCRTAHNLAQSLNSWLQMSEKIVATDFRLQRAITPLGVVAPSCARRLVRACASSTVLTFESLACCLIFWVVGSQRRLLPAKLLVVTVRSILVELAERAVVRSSSVVSDVPGFFLWAVVSAQQAWSGLSARLT